MRADRRGISGYVGRLIRVVRLACRDELVGERRIETASIFDNPSRPAEGTHGIGRKLQRARLAPQWRIGS